VRSVTSVKKKYNYIPRVRVVDGRDSDIAEAIADPGIRLLDYRKAHISVNRLGLRSIETS